MKQVNNYGLSISNVATVSLESTQIGDNISDAISIRVHSILIRKRTSLDRKYKNIVPPILDVWTNVVPVGNSVERSIRHKLK